MYKSIMREVRMWVWILALCALVVLLFVLLFDSSQEIFILMSRDSHVYSYYELMEAISAGVLVGCCAIGLPYSFIFIFDLYKTGSYRNSSPTDQKDA